MQIHLHGAINEALFDKTIGRSACVAEKRRPDWIFSVFLSFLGQAMRIEKYARSCCEQRL